MCGQSQAPAALTLGKRPGTHCTGGWVGPRGMCARMRELLPPPGFDTRTIQHVASRYTDYPHPSHTLLKQYLHILTTRNVPIQNGDFEHLK